MGAGNVSRVGGDRPLVTTRRHPVGNPGISKATPERDALLRGGRALLYLGLALSSLLTLRGPASLTVGDLLFGAAATCAAFSRVRPARLLPPAIVAAAIVLVVGGVVAAEVSSDLGQSLLAAFRLVYLVLVVPWTVLNLLVERHHVVRAVGWWIAGAAVCSLGAVAQMLAGDIIPGGEVTNSGRFTGFTGHVSDLGGISSVGAAAALVAISVSATRRGRRWALLAFGCCITGLVLSGSVSGMIALLAALLVALARRSLRLPRLLAVAATAAGLLGVLFQQQAQVGALTPLGRFLQASGLIATDSDLATADSRSDLMGRAWAGIQSDWFAGHGMVGADNLLIGNLTVHNLFLAAWHGGGILTLLGVVIVTWLAIRYGWRRSPDDPTREVLAAATVAALLFAQTGPSFYNRYFWLPVGLLIAVEVIRRSSPGPRPQVAPPA